ncbi:MAG: porin family protein [Saprospiraceae bacterium]|nr:porin family protein [Saprospiraceae bacterium]
MTRRSKLSFTILLFLITVLLLPSIAKAQQNYGLFENWNANFNLGYNKFYGDITDKKNSIFRNTPFHKYFYENRKMMYGFMFGKDINDIVNVRGQILYGNIKGTSEIYLSYFDAKLFEYNLNAKVNLSNLILGTSSYRSYSFYATAGIGMVNWNTQRKDLKTGVVLDGNGFVNDGGIGALHSTEGVIPIGLGVEFNLNDNWQIALESTLHGIKTDKLDAYFSESKKVEGFGYVSVSMEYTFDFKAFRFGSSNPKFNGRSNEPALKDFGKKKKVVMTSPQYNKAKNKRYRKYKGYKKSPFNLFKKHRLKFAK